MDKFIEKKSKKLYNLVRRYLLKLQQVSNLFKQYETFKRPTHDKEDIFIKDLTNVRGYNICKGFNIIL